ncbi:hypothetical protein [Methanosphaera sp.]
MTMSLSFSSIGGVFLSSLGSLIISFVSGIITSSSIIISLPIPSSL